LYINKPVLTIKIISYSVKLKKAGYYACADFDRNVSITMIIKKPPCGNRRALGIMYLI
jgi:hypothetical protein